jgi:hypothetical protein
LKELLVCSVIMGFALFVAATGASALPIHSDGAPETLVASSDEREAPRAGLLAGLLEALCLGPLFGHVGGAPFALPDFAALVNVVAVLPGSWGELPIPRVGGPRHPIGLLPVPGPTITRPVPEPGAAFAFAAGTLVVGAVLRGRRCRCRARAACTCPRA